MQLKEIMGFQTAHSHGAKWIPQPIFKGKEVPIDVQENSLFQKTTLNFIEHSQSNSNYILSGYDSWMVSNIFLIKKIKLFSCFLTRHHLHRNMIQEKFSGQTEQNNIVH